MSYFPVDLVQRFTDTRKTSVELAAPLSEADSQLQSMTDASPTKWHLAHTTWFFETFLLQKFDKSYSVFNDLFGYLFNSYYNGVGKQYPREKRGLISRPPLQEVHEYRTRVEEKMHALLDQTLPQEAHFLVELGIQHEQQHQELLLTDIKHALFQNPIYPSYLDFSSIDNDANYVPLAWHTIDEGLYEIGADHQCFAFDNEQPQHQVFHQTFALANRLITNQEFRDFINDGGYKNPLLWLSDGWSWINQNKHEHPIYWIKEHDGWSEFTLAGKKELSLQKPVTHINFYEAHAFASWAGYRLPTEFEWETACKLTQPQAGTLLQLPHIHPNASRSREELGQMIGDTWEWTTSAYSPYPGFKQADGAVGEYNGKFMANQLVLRGGSCATPANHIRASYRNFFYPHQSWQFNGIRLAKNI